MSNLFKRLAKLPSRFAASIFNREPDTRKDPAHLSFPKGIHPQDKDSIFDAFWAAADLLKRKGHIKDTSHKIREIAFIAGEKYTPQQEWGFLDKASGQWVAARCGGRKIEFAVNPETRRMNQKRGFRDARHEWGHAFLAIAHPRTTTEQQHEMMGF